MRPHLNRSNRFNTFPPVSAMRRAFPPALAVFCLALTLDSRGRAESQASPSDFKATPEQEAFFEKSVRPILVARCLECHGEKKQEGGLRLDSRAALLKEGDAGPAIVVGKPEESRLVEVIGYGDAIKMPPKEKLSDQEIATLTDWIRQGAAFPATQESTSPALGQLATPDGIKTARQTLWSLQPIGHPEPPPVNHSTWARTPIDQFVLSKLESAGLKPSPPADKRTLLRRVTFDLIGLPPTAAEQAAFESDNSPNAFATVVDRLLASPRYGERWGRHWLDVARYADTKGYVFTEERKYPFSYTYRDYVIRAFNNDLPFNRFILEQLAADQLALGDDKAPLAAMGFLTLGRRFGNNQNDIIDDRIDVVARGLMGLTVACARCHDHKYDPIPTDDYYSLYGVFASSVEPADLPQIGPPTDIEAYRVYEDELKKREAALDEFIAAKRSELEDELRNRVTDYLVAVVRKEGENIPDGIGISVGTGELRPPVVRRWKEFLDEQAKQPHPVFGPWTAFSKLSADGFAEQAGVVVAALNDAADAQPRTNALVKRALTEKTPTSMLEVAALYGKLLTDVNQQWIKLRTEGGQPQATALPDAAAEEVRQVLYAEQSPAHISTEGRRRLFDRATSNRISELKRAVDAHKANSPAAPPRAMVMNDAPQPAQPRVFIRGNPGRPGKEVPRRFLQVLSPEGGPAFRQGSGRLELAQAIVSPENPLTARVFVNRVWLQHFGRGLVATPSDFGTRGYLPSHPELLDYLARTFIDEGWSVKKLHRRILLSAAYQQASDDRPEGEQVDPENRLVWRMNRKRLEFEPLRDSLLAVAGRLDMTEGGRPVDLFSTPFTTRRAVYGFIDRQDLPGTLRVFDFASPDVSTPMRPQTTVPQQALFSLNSPFVIEQARNLAAHPEVVAASDAESRVRALYRLIYARTPDSQELAVGVSFLTEPPPAEPALTGVWQYGFGEFDEATRKLAGFTPLPHFQDRQYRGGPQLPDGALGWTSLGPEGGHPGGTPKLAAVRRWIAPRAGSISIAATLSHAAEQGDGVRGRIVSSRVGVLDSWTIHHGKVETKIDHVDVDAGETIDFVVDCLTNEAFDSFTWPPVIVMVTAGAAPQQWNAPADFKGPPERALTVLEQYAQALLVANEFVFVD